MDTTGTFALVSDANNNAIRYVVISSCSVTTLAGTPGATGSSDGTVSTFYSPSGVAIDPSGTFALVSDEINQLIRRVDVRTGLVTTVAGTLLWPGYTDGAGSDAMFDSPQGIMIDGTGSLALVVDSNNNVIRGVDVATGRVSTVAGSTARKSGFNDGVGTAASFNSPVGISMGMSWQEALIVSEICACANARSSDAAPSFGAPQVDFKNNVIRTIVVPSPSPSTSYSPSSTPSRSSKTPTQTRTLTPSRFPQSACSVNGDCASCAAGSVGGLALLPWPCFLMSNFPLL